MVEKVQEIAFYEEIFEFILADLEKVQAKGMITEGAAYLPNLMKKLSISKNRYLSITPSKDFQVHHYRKRVWVPHVLEECSDKEKSFSNWMYRDILFAQEVQRQCNENQYFSIINDGSIELDELVGKVALQLGLSD